MSATTQAVYSGELPRQEVLRRIGRLSRLARVMDTAVQIPGTGIRFGADSVLGLVPGIGDAAGGLIGLFIVNEARKLGLPKRKLLRMLANLGADTLAGSVPLVGDVFDVVFKSHRRNVGIVLDHFGEGGTLGESGSFAEQAWGMKDVTPSSRR